MQKHSASSTMVFQNALEYMASLDLIELCNEAKIEHCRATRDLSSCGRYVHHVLSSCGHASLCLECSQRCDVCPICRVSLPTSGNKVRLRLYYKCIEEGLISKKYDDLFLEKKDKREYSMYDVQRLYSLFDVALENNLVSLVCHYILDVCMDESAVSSDPVVAFLLDGKVVKEWCRRKFKAIADEIHGIYTLDVETMVSKLSTLQKLASQLSGISGVLEVLQSAFRDAPTLQLQNLQDLFESASKAKQHLEVMAWCIQHKFLDGIQSKFSSFASWKSHVYERKTASVERSWPDFTRDSMSAVGSQRGLLFIEQALANLGIEESLGRETENISCLQDEKSPLLFHSRIDEARTGYPFVSLRAAADVLFLHGSSDMAVAKQAIFLYYLFDRQWSRPEAEWRYLVDDFAGCFGISTHSLLESLTFYLLDDHTEPALQEACNILPKIAIQDLHPKIGHVLLERRRPDVALTVLRCSGHDGFCTTAISDLDGNSTVSLSVAVTVVRVKIECGLLTEAFMYQRTHCSKVKDNVKHGCLAAIDNKSGSLAYHIEVLVSEICLLCIRRNLVDRFIELPWNSDEEKYLDECLLYHASRGPSSVCGSLLVVYYLQRFRYVEACLVDRKLRLTEENIARSASEEVSSKMNLIRQWRGGLIDNCLQLLPEAQRRQLMTNSAENCLPSYNALDLPNETVQPVPLPTSSALKPPLVLQTNHSSFPSTSPGSAFAGLNSPTSRRSPDIGSGSGSGRGASILQRRLIASSVESPSSFEMARKADGPNDMDASPSNGSFHGWDMQGHLSTRLSSRSSTLFNSKGAHRDASPGSPRDSPIHDLLDAKTPRTARRDLAGHAQREHPHVLGAASEDPGSNTDAPLSNGSGLGWRPLSVVEPKLLARSRSNASAEGAAATSPGFPWSFSKGEDPPIKSNKRDAPFRWRSDESSDEELPSLGKHVGGGGGSTPVALQIQDKYPGWR